MSYKILTNGTAADADEVMGLLEEGYRIQGQSIINTLQDRAITFTADGGIFAEAYTSVTGRNGSVNNGTLLIDSATSIFAPFNGETTLGTLHDPNTFTNPTNAFDGDIETFATKSSTYTSTGTTSVYLGRTFSATYVGGINVRVTGSFGGSAARGQGLSIETYDGSTWSDFVTILTHGDGSNDNYDISRYIAIKQNIQGIRIRMSHYRNATSSYTAVNNVYVAFFNNPLETELTHTIPSGTFSSTLSSSYATFKAVGWETGADVQYKLTNATEDTGYLNMNEVAEFTALTSTPTKMIVKLIPKGTAPTSGFPSISGVTLFADKP